MGSDIVAAVGDGAMLDEVPVMMVRRMAEKVDQENVFISKIGKGRK